MANKTQRIYKKKYPVLNESCKGCKYYNTLGWCDYGEIKKALRPCPGGDECTVMEKGKKIPRETDFTIYEGYDPETYYYSAASHYWG